MPPARRSRRRQPTGPERLQPWFQYVIAPTLGIGMLVFETLTEGTRVIVFVTGIALLGVPASAWAQKWLRAKIENGR